MTTSNTTTTPDPDPLALAGTTIAEKYAVERVVGEGGFAVVYRAMHLIWKRPVAIKVFKAMGDFKPEQRQKLEEAFLQEGALLAELSERSSAICQARDVGTLTTVRGAWLPFLVLEWLEGRTLEQVLRDEIANALPLRGLSQVIELLDPVAEALALAHRRGIAHRDLKPANIFILGDPRGADRSVKLLDFGIAKVVQDAQKLTGAFAQTGGAPTSFTPAYGAPEQFSRHIGSTGPWTDVFALALIVSEILTGKEPLAGDSLAQVAFASTDAAHRPTPRALGASVSDPVERVLARAVAVPPSERYEEAGAFWNALREAAGMGGLRAPVSSGHVASAGDVASAPTFVAPPGPTSDPMRSSARVVVASAAPSTPGLAGAPASGATGPGGAAVGAAVGGTRPPRGSGVALAVGGVVVVLAGAVAAFAWSARRDGSARAGGAGEAQSAAASASASSVAPSASSSAAGAPAAACPSGMIAVPGGPFFMGSDDDRDNEKPAHNVRLDPFCIDEFEATTEAYKACSDTGECKRASSTNDFDGITDAFKKALDPLCNVREPEDRAKHPINCVTWEMADGFCRAKGKRLPTEAEWEFAARGPDGRKYPWGDDRPGPTFLNACGKECVAWGKKNHLEQSAMYALDDGWPTTAPVGSFPAGKSRYGVQDVVGNVWEWVADWYAPYPKGGAPDTDPKGPPTGDDRVVRGGAWNGGDPDWVRPAYRFHVRPSTKSYGIGFRCAR